MGHFGFFDWFAMKAGWTILYGPANASCAKGGSKGNFTFPWYVGNSSSSFFMAAQTIQLHLVTRSMTETPKKYDIMTSSVFSFQKLCKILNWNTFQSSEVCDNLETCVSFTMDLMCVCMCVCVFRSKSFSATCSATTSLKPSSLCHMTQTLRMRPPTYETTSCVMASKTYKWLETTLWETAVRLPIRINLFIEF